MFVFSHASIILVEVTVSHDGSNKYLNSNISTITRYVCYEIWFTHDYIDFSSNTIIKVKVKFSS